MRHVKCYYVTLLNREVVRRVKLCLVSAFPHIVKDYIKIRNLPKIFLRSFKNVAYTSLRATHQPFGAHCCHVGTAI